MKKSKKRGVFEREIENEKRESNKAQVDTRYEFVERPLILGKAEKLCTS